MDGGLVSMWRRHKHHIILAWLSFMQLCWRDRIGAQLLVVVKSFFLDSIAARVLKKGSSRDVAWRKLLLLFENLESECSSRCWFARVPSKSNVAYEPSRSEAGVSASGAVKTTPVCPISRSLVSLCRGIWKIVGVKVA